MFRVLASHTQKISAIAGRSLLFGGVLVSLLSQSTGQNSVRALEAQTQIATGTWQGASFPVENFQGYTSPFGLRRAPDGSYTQEYHRGLDMASPEGSYVRNWWRGKVVEVSDDSACGTSVVVQSGQWEHIYCHMKGLVEKEKGGRYMIDRDGGIQIWEGQTVQAGDRIGRVGMTGRTTGPHLHWGMKYAGQWVDPALVLRAMYSEQTARNSVSVRP
jgi:murein DD-endopeptidase MepM/ murein hydrolase activator NlpD